MNGHDTQDCFKIATRATLPTPLSTFHFRSVYHGNAPPFNILSHSLILHAENCIHITWCSSVRITMKINGTLSTVEYFIRCYASPCDSLNAGDFWNHFISAISSFLKNFSMQQTYLTSSENLMLSYELNAL